MSSITLLLSDKHDKEDTMNLLELFVQVDDFCQQLAKLQSQQPALPNKHTRNRALQMQPSEIMTLLILFHTAHYRDFKAFYVQHVCQHLKSEFPGLPSYNRFVEWIPRCLLPLTAYLFTQLGLCSGVTYVDSTALKVCHNRRIRQHKTFKNWATRGKTSVDWFFGFKLHLLFNDQGEILWLQLTPGNVDDRKGLLAMIENPFSSIFGRVFGDLGYLSKTLFERLIQDHGIALITKLKSNMHTSLPMLAEDGLFLRYRCIAETIIDQLKNISQIEHSRHRSPVNFVVNLVCGLIAYCHQPKKPGLGLVVNQLVTP
jgi:Transposase DDE domain